MTDNEMYGRGGELKCAIKKLGETWRYFLGLSNKQLYIDEEYTRPGIERLLEQFQKKCDDLYEVGEYIKTRNLFKWRP